LNVIHKREREFLGRERENLRREKQREMLGRFIRIYCSAHHGTAGERLCAECEDLAVYARERLDRCPHHPKPSCKKCPTHCYKPDYRARIREVMRFSGLHLIRHGRLDLIVKYYL
jgi:hypothetical protein